MIVDDFMEALRSNVDYWDSQEKSSREKLEGATHAILYMLDCISCSFSPNIHCLHTTALLHEMWAQSKLEREKDF